MDNARHVIIKPVTRMVLAAAFEDGFLSQERQVRTACDDVASNIHQFRIVIAMA